MADFLQRALAWARRLVAGRPDAEPPELDAPRVVDGATAAAAVEALLGVRLPERPGTAADEVARAVGGAAAGRRVAAWIDGEALPLVIEELRQAAELRLPLVVHAHLGAGHDALHVAADSGCAVLFAASVAEAADLTLAARRLAEDALIPVIVAMDTAEVARAPQDVALPTAGLVDRVAGRADDRIDTPTEAQRLVFGASRRRVPLLHDIDAPALLGARVEGLAGAAALAARLSYQDADTVALLDGALAAVARATGRELAAVGARGAASAEAAVVAQGALVEQLRAAAGDRVAVVGLTALRPFPAEALRAAVGSRSRLAVVERSGPVAGDGPLAREVAAALGRSPARVFAGLAGSPVRRADLLGLVDEVASGPRDRLVLGVDLAPAVPALPKLQARLDALRRAFPDAGRLGLRVDGAAAAPEGALVVALVRDAGQADWLPAFAGVLQAATGGAVRCRAAAGGSEAGGERVDLLVAGPAGMADPGAELAADVVVLARREGRRGRGVAVADGAAVLAAMRASAESAGGEEFFDDELAASIDAGLLAALSRAGGRLFGALADDLDPLLGAFLGVLRERGIAWKDRAVIAARRQALGGGADARLRAMLEAVGAAREVAAGPAAGDDEDALPLVVREAAGAGEGLSAIAPFWDRVGAAGRTGGAPVPDPAGTFRVVPPLTATFHGLAGERSDLPAIDVAACTGCGACWSACPEAAIGAVALTPKAWIEGGIAAANRAGSSAEALRPVAGQLATLAGRALQKGEVAPGRAGDVFRHAFGVLVDKAGIEGERRSGMEAALAAVDEAVGDLPVAVTDPFFRRPEAAGKGRGELLGLAVDPEACKACGACAAVCEPGAIQVVPQEGEVLARARRAWRAWERTPDTPGTTVARAWDDPEVGPVAATLLSRHALFTVASGDGAQPGSGEKVALRAVLGVMESRLQKAVADHLSDIDELADRLVAECRRVIGETLPVDDLEAVEAGGAGHAGPDLTLEAVVRRIDEAHGEHARLLPADAGRLRRMAALARELRDRAAAMREGFGRARMGLVLSPDIARRWAGRFPHAPFLAPAVVAATDRVAGFARGLAEGQVAQAGEVLARVRRARLELERPDEARRAGPVEPAPWSALDEGERQVVPPVVIVGDDGLLRDSGIAALVDAGLPVKVIVLSPLDLTRSGDELELLALGRRGARVAQSSIALPRHLAESVVAAVAWPGPAVLRLHAPLPDTHGFSRDRTPRRALRAVETRAWPVFRFDPRADGVFGSRLSLDGNPEVEAGLVAEAGTPLDWMLGEDRYLRRLAPLDPDVSSLPASRLFDEDPAGRPVRVDLPEGARAIPADLAAGLRDRAATWRTLQELAGVVTPFTERVRERLAAEMAAAHQAELDALRAEYEERIAALQASFEEQAVQRVRDGLVRLLSRAAPAGEG